MFGVHHHRRRPLLQRPSLTPKKVWGRVASLILSSYLYVVMKGNKEQVISLLKQTVEILNANFGNVEEFEVDVEHMAQQLERDLLELEGE